MARRAALAEMFWTWAVFGGLIINLATSGMFLVLIAGYGPSLHYNVVGTVRVWRAAARYSGGHRWADLTRIVTVTGMTAVSLSWGLRQAVAPCDNHGRRQRMTRITAAENELLTRTGPGTRMGGLLRRYWLPAMLSERLPEPDCAPGAVLLFGERLVVFRDTEGRVGLLDEFCPHRRVSLVYGRNEECGLRCVFHGWKFDVHGRVLETPAEVSPDFGKNIRHTAYPTCEAGGIVWTYMGPDSAPPPFPDFFFTTLPANQVLG
jgi:nitrite reductase/ring-hydroxylating ferredoxin subunit